MNHTHTYIHTFAKTYTYTHTHVYTHTHTYTCVNSVQFNRPFVAGAGSRPSGKEEEATVKR